MYVFFVKMNTDKGPNDQKNISFPSDSIIFPNISGICYRVNKR